MKLVPSTGFDAFAAGLLAESWRLKPRTPVCCTDLIRAEMLAALGSAQKEPATTAHGRSSPNEPRVPWTVDGGFGDYRQRPTEQLPTAALAARVLANQIVQGQPWDQEGMAWWNAPSSSWKSPSCRAGFHAAGGLLAPWPGDPHPAHKGDMLHFHQLHCPLVPGSSGPYLRKGLVHCSVPRRTLTGLSTSSIRTVRISWDGRSLGKNSRPWVFYLIVLEPNHEELTPALRKAFQTQTLIS